MPVITPCHTKLWCLFVVGLKKLFNIQLTCRYFETHGAFLDTYPTPCPHYNDVIMSVMASRITNLTTVYSTVYSGTDQRNHQSSTSLAFVCVLGGVSGDRCIPRTKAGNGENVFMTSSCYQQWGQQTGEKSSEPMSSTQISSTAALNIYEQKRFVCCSYLFNAIYIYMYHEIIQFYFIMTYCTPINTYCAEFV